jgi:hypothetical protein
MMQSYFSTPFHNTNEEKDVVHEANVLYMNMGDFTNRVLRECESVLKRTGKGFVLIHDQHAGNASLWGMTPAEGLLASQQLIKDHPHIFECYESIKRPTLERLIKAGGEREIKKIYTGRSCEGLIKECDTYNTISGKTNEVEISKLKIDNRKEIEECMHNDDFAKFKTIYPESIQKFWTSMHRDWQSKAYR